MTSSPLSPLRILSRVAASLLGGYAFVWGFITLGVSLAVAAGMGYEQAQTLLFMLSGLVFLVCFCWAFATASAARAWAVLAGGGALMTSLSWLVSRVVLG